MKRSKYPYRISDQEGVKINKSTKIVRKQYSNPVEKLIIRKTKVTEETNIKEDKNLREY